MDQKGLPDVREIEVVVECGCGPDRSGFDAAMVRGRNVNKVGLLAALEKEFDVLEKCGLVSFDGEVKVGLSLLDQIGRDLALGQQGIGRNVKVNWF